MGFYSPSQLIQDAQRHHIEVRPLDVGISQWDHTLESPTSTAAQPALRLGLRMIKGLSLDAADRIMQAQRQGFRSAQELARMANLDDQQLGFLARSGALYQLAGHRHQAHWDVTGIAAPLPLERSQTDGRSCDLAIMVTDPAQQDTISLHAPSVTEDMFNDYRYTGLTLGPHPMTLLREHPELRGFRRAVDLEECRTGQMIRIGRRGYRKAAPWYRQRRRIPNAGRRNRQHQYGDLGFGYGTFPSGTTAGPTTEIQGRCRTRRSRDSRGRRSCRKRQPSSRRLSVCPADLQIPRLSLAKVLHTETDSQSLAPPAARASRSISPIVLIAATAPQRAIVSTAFSHLGFGYVAHVADGSKAKEHLVHGLQPEEYRAGWIWIARVAVRIIHRPLRNQLSAPQAEIGAHPTRT